MRNHHVAFIRYARRPIHFAPKRSGLRRLLTRRLQPHDHGPVQPVLTTGHVKTYRNYSTMMRAEISEDQRFTVTAQQLTPKSLKILENAKSNNFAVKLT